MDTKSLPESDLALERRRADTDIDGVEYKKLPCGRFLWERIRITSKAGEESIGRPRGIYDTLTLPRMDRLDTDGEEDAAEELARELCYLFDTSNIQPRRILVAGIGNRALTPDSIGPKTAEKITPTMHISGFDSSIFEALECSEIAVIAPGVTASSGMESSEIIKSICDAIKPDAVIAVDSLASRSSSRLGATVQICNTGIFPGSGIGNRRGALNRESLGVPVIAIGVPSVIDTRIFIDEELSRRAKYSKGAKTDTEPMFVSPREIDSITDVASRIIAGAINQAFGVQM